MQNRQFILKSRPEFLAGPENFELITSPVMPLKQGEARVAVEMVALSAWQGMRTKDFKNFIRPFNLGELIDCDVFGGVGWPGRCVLWDLCVQSRCGADQSDQPDHHHATR